MTEKTSITNTQLSSDSPIPIQNNETENNVNDGCSTEHSTSSQLYEQGKTSNINTSEDGWEKLDDDYWEELSPNKKHPDKKSNIGKKIGVAVVIIIVIAVVVGVLILFSGNILSFLTIPSYDTNTITSGDILSGSLSITSAPSNAEVYLNDEYKGKTPLVINSLSPGRYTLKISKPDNFNHYIDEIMTVTINSGVTTEKEVMITLGGEIYVRTDPAGALLYIDAEYKGVSPMTIEGIKPGRHKLEAILEGYDKEIYEFKSGIGTSNSVSLFFIGKTYG